MNKFGDTHSRSLCQLATRLLTYTMQHQIQLTAEYIPGRLNMTADVLSRQLNPHQHEWQLCPNIFNGILHQTQTYPNINLFDSRLNRRISKFFSWRPDTEAWAVNAFVLRWQDLGYYTCSLLDSNRPDSVQTDQGECLLSNSNSSILAKQALVAPSPSIPGSNTNLPPS